MAFAQTSLAAMSFENLQELTKLSFADFSAAHPDHVAHFTGFKTWLTGEDGRVKLYVNHDGMPMEFNYLCHSHDGQLECHHQ